MISTFFDKLILGLVVGCALFTIWLLATDSSMFKLFPVDGENPHNLRNLSIMVVWFLGTLSAIGVAATWVLTAIINLYYGMREAIPKLLGRRQSSTTRLENRTKKMGLSATEFTYAMQLQVRMDPSRPWGDKKYMTGAANKFLDTIEQQAINIAKQWNGHASWEQHHNTVLKTAISAFEERLSPTVDFDLV